jgi:hypothetical protein
MVTSKLQIVSHLDGPCAHVRDKKHIGVPDKARVDLGLFLEDIQAGGVDLAAIEGLDEGLFVHDCASRRVDNHDTVLHLLKLGFADDVAGVFLLK